LKKINGFTMVEALMAMAIVLFIVVSILSGFTQQMISNRYAGAKNIAISLAETRLEDYMKLPATQMTALLPAASVDYVVERGRHLVVSTADPDAEDQYRRTVTYAPSTAQAAVNVVRVVVEYGKHGDIYPFRVVLTSQRGG
jgi:type II secretory pathway pseudopilin PulG